MSLIKPVFFVALFAALSQAALTQQTAKQIALKEIQNISVLTACGKWTSQTVITDAFPVYIDGIPDISYYECKAKTGTTDAGYVLVNINQTDIIIAESATSGLTLTEQYRTKLGTANFTLCRYDEFCSAALDPATKAVLSTMGFNNPRQAGLAKTTADGLSLAITKFRQSAQTKGCNPDYVPADLLKYYGDSTRTALGKVAAVSTDFVELKNGFSCSSYGYGTVKSPVWQQVKKSDGNFIGCGPTAWAIVYGYWKQFKGKNKLFPDLANLNSTFCWNSTDYSTVNKSIFDCMTKCSNAMGTFNVPFTDQAATIPSMVQSGSYYAIDLGYVVSCHTDNFVSYNEVRESITNDQPVILLTGEGFWAQLVGFPSHYVVIEKYVRYNKDALFGLISYPSSIRYYCNYGWGGTWKWVYALDMGTLQAYNKCLGSTYISINDFQQFSFKATPEGGKAPLTVKFTPLNNTGNSLMVVRWEFGEPDGSGNTNVNWVGGTMEKSHTYNKPGVYTVTLKGAILGGAGWNYTCTKTGLVKVFADGTITTNLLLLE